MVESICDRVERMHCISFAHTTTVNSAGTMSTLVSFIYITGVLYHSLLEFLSAFLGCNIENRCDKMLDFLSDAPSPPLVALTFALARENVGTCDALDMEGSVPWRGLRAGLVNRLAGVELLAIVLIVCRPPRVEVVCRGSDKSDREQLALTSPLAL